MGLSSRRFVGHSQKRREPRAPFPHYFSKIILNSQDPHPHFEIHRADSCGESCKEKRCISLDCSVQIKGINQPSGSIFKSHRFQREKIKQAIDIILDGLCSRILCQHFGSELVSKKYKKNSTKQATKSITESEKCHNSLCVCLCVFKGNSFRAS